MDPIRGNYELRSKLLPLIGSIFAPDFLYWGVYKSAISERSKLSHQDVDLIWTFVSQTPISAGSVRPLEMSVTAAAQTLSESEVSDEH